MLDSAEQKIKEAARKILLVKGFDGSRMQEIADEAGVNKAMLNYYFRSKKALFQMVFMEEFGKLFENMITVLLDDCPWEDKIKAFVNTELNHLLQAPQLPLFIINEMSKNPHLMEEKLKSISVGNVFEMAKTKYEKEIQDGKLRNLPFIQFLMNLQSLCIFPILAKPVLMQISKVSDMEYHNLINQRKALVSELLISYMIIK